MNDYFYSVAFGVIGWFLYESPEYNGADRFGYLRGQYMLNGPLRQLADEENQ